MMLLVTTTFAAITVALSASAGFAMQDADDAAADRADVPAVLNFKVTDIDGKQVDLAKYKGQTILIVNVASRCGFTPQYEGLQELYRKYDVEEGKEREFVILGFPCNQFRGQEPGTEEEIKTFCTENYGVTFPLFSKIDVNGDDAAPLYKLLTDPEKTPVSQGEIRWNFEKFLIDKNGKVVKHYRSRETPEQVGKDVEKVMKGEAITTE